MNQFLVCALAAGFFWGLWPLLLKASELKGVLPLLITYIGAISVGVLALTFFKSGTAPPLKGASICFMAGVLNGVAVLFFVKITGSSDKSASISNLYSLALMVELVVGFVGGCCYFGEEVTMRKIFGCIFAGIALVLFA